MGIVMQTNAASPFQLVPNTPSLVANTKVSSPVPIVPERGDIVSKFVLSELPMTEATVPSTPNQCMKVLDMSGAPQQFSHNSPSTPQINVFYNSQEQRVPSPLIHKEQQEVESVLQFERSRGKDRARIKKRRIAVLTEGPQNKWKCKETLFMPGDTDDIFG